MPSFRQLQYLVAVAEQQHFGRAASVLNVSQPTLSLQLQKLENELSIRLVDRTHGKVHLTPVGREVVSRARKLLLDLKDLQDIARQSAGELVGTIRFGVSPTIGPYLMPGIIGIMKNIMPKVRFHIREGIPGEQVQMLRNGSLDMLLAPLPAGGADLDVELLFQERLFLVAHPDHELGRKAVVKREDLAGMHVLSIDPRHHFHKQTQAICDELSAELLSDYEGSSLDSLCQMCASGLGIAILPELYLRSEVGGRNVITPLLVSDWCATRSIAAIWRSRSAYKESYRKIAKVISREAAMILCERPRTGQL